MSVPSHTFTPMFLDFADFKRKAWTTVLVDRGAAMGKNRLQYSTPVYVDNATAGRLLLNASSNRLGDHRLYQWDGKQWVDAFEPGRLPNQGR